VVAVAVLAASLPASYAQRLRTCEGAGCPQDSLTPVEVERLTALGLGQGGYAALTLTLVLVVALTYLAVAGLLLRAVGDRRDAAFSAAVLIVAGVTFAQTLPALAVGSTAGRVVVEAFEVAATAVFVGWLLTFPDGRFRPRAGIGIVLVLLVADALARFGVSPPAPVEAAGTAALFGLVLAVVVRRFSGWSRTERRRASWVVGGFGIALVGLALASLLQQGAGVGPGSVADLAVQVGICVAFLAIPLGVAAAMVRRGLFGVGPGLARAMTYALLTAVAFGAYILVVAMAAALSLGRSGAPVVTAALLAVAIHPVYLVLRRAVNRLLYGTPEDPSELLARLAEAPGPAPTAEVLERAAEALRHVLAVTAVEITVPGVTTAVAGEAGVGVTERVGLRHHGDVVGELVLYRPEAESELPARARALGEPVLAHVALLCHAAALDHHLHESRRELVTAREEERRRIRNDLHDGVGPTLGAIGLSLAAAGHTLGSDPDKARVLLQQARRQTSVALLDVRRAVYGLRPPALDELGLVGALEAFVRGVGADMDVTVEADAPTATRRLPAAVEVAAYLIALESVTNAVRHSSGSRCTVVLDAGAHRLVLEVSDDGSQAGDGPGVGMASMADRAAELGGSLHVTRTPHGTTVRAELPLTREPADG
jgi:signal transduction histidine kinase